MTRLHLGIDGHSAVGVIGLFGSITLANYSAFMAAITATATALYMAHRAWREWKNKK
jgi:hypothetical protein